ncbi:MAG: GAF and ANTAR domain-containing protein [Egibacteraceae bacterium]
MVDHIALTRTFARFTRTINSGYELGDLLYQLIDQAIEVLDVTAAGLSVAHPAGRLRFVSLTHHLLMPVKNRQIEIRQGPGRDAYHTGEPVFVADLNKVDTWPAYTPAALRAGCQAVASLPLKAEGACIGALTLYCDLPRCWTDHDIAVAQLLADMATVYIINASSLNHSPQLAEQLRNALRSRVVIEQAKGMLVEQCAVSA